MAEFVEAQKIPYPVAADIDKKTTTAFRVDSYPDYYLIDRAGKLRVADLANGDLERSVKVLLAEAAPGEQEPAVPIEEVDARFALKEALARAGDEDRKVLVHLGGPG